MFQLRYSDSHSHKIHFLSSVCKLASMDRVRPMSSRLPALAKARYNLADIASPLNMYKVSRYITRIY